MSAYWDILVARNTEKARQQWRDDFTFRVVAGTSRHDHPVHRRTQTRAILTRAGLMSLESAALFGAAGGAYVLADGVARKYRGGKEDLWTCTVGGLASGAVVGLRTMRVGKSIGAMAAFAAAGAIMHTFDSSKSPAVSGPWDRREMVPE